MIIVVTGSRTWTNESLIKSRLEYWELHARNKEDTLTVIVGYDPVKQTPIGVDKMVYKWCKALGINVIPEPADWKNGRINYFGSRAVNMAGFDRNELMLDKHNPDLVVAFRAEGKSNGTDHCVKEARKRNIPVELNRE